MLIDTFSDKNVQVSVEFQSNESSDLKTITFICPVNRQVVI